MALVKRVYEVSESFPRAEQFGLTTQLRKAAVSVPSNIAEGKGRKTKRDYVQFLYRARGSLYEVETQMEVARNLNYISDAVFAQMAGDAAGVARVLSGLITAIEKQIKESGANNSSWRAPGIRPSDEPES